MKNTTFAFLFFFTAFLYAAPQKVERYLLVAGANNGGTDRVKLRYAESDANSFAGVMSQMGGVDKSNVLRVFDPNAKAMQNGFAELEKRLQGREADVRREVIVYYSGHADEKGLRLGSDVYTWAEFRKNVNNIDAEVKVAILDACGSGAITRTKGGVSRPAFLQDASSEMKGYAFLTSSNENEASQESDRIKGSFFTHALVGGLRGAADMTGNGKVTLSEAYQYAFDETLRNTQNTSAGSQHPNRDMNLAGTGDIVMTDLRETSAVLTLDSNLEGRLFIRDEQGNLFAELNKIRGRQIELGMPVGKYSIQMEVPSKIWMAKEVQISEGKKNVLSMNDMQNIEREKAVARGNADSTRSFNFYSFIINIARNAGVQVGVVNMAFNAGKAQGGVVNVAGKTEYGQGGVVNIAGNNAGKAQGGVVNVAGKTEYGQGGVVNVAGNAGKVQWGVVNIGGNVGRQIGIVNVATKSENTPIGLINVIGNGIIDGTFYADETGRTGIALHTGTPYFYTVLEYALDPTTLSNSWRNTWQPQSWGWGLGTRFGMLGNFFSLDYSYINVYNENPLREKDNHLQKIRFGAAYKLLTGIALSSGLTFNALFKNNGDDFYLEPRGEYHWHWTFGDHKVRLWPGLYAGFTVGKF